MGGATNAIAVRTCVLLLLLLLPSRAWRRWHVCWLVFRCFGSGGTTRQTAPPNSRGPLKLDMQILASALTRVKQWPCGNDAIASTQARTRWKMRWPCTIVDAPKRWPRLTHKSCKQASPVLEREGSLLLGFGTFIDGQYFPQLWPIRYSSYRTTGWLVDKLNPVADNSQSLASLLEPVPNFKLIRKTSSKHHGQASRVGITKLAFHRP